MKKQLIIPPSLFHLQLIYEAPIWAWRAFIFMSQFYIHGQFHCHCTKGTNNHLKSWQDSNPSAYFVIYHVESEDAERASGLLDAADAVPDVLARRDAREDLAQRVVGGVVPLLHWHLKVTRN